MARAKLGNYVVNEADKRVLVNLFKDPTATKAFIQFLDNVSLQAMQDMRKTTDVYLMNNDPATRAFALQQKGKVELLGELVTLIQEVVK